MRLNKLCSSYVVQLHSYLHGSCCISVLLLLLGKSLENVCKQGHGPNVYALQAAQFCTEVSNVQAACAAAAAAVISVQQETGAAKPF